MADLFLPFIACMQVGCELLAGSRTSRMVKDLVIPQKLVSASAYAAYPGEKHAGVTLAFDRKNASDLNCVNAEGTLNQTLNSKEHTLTHPPTPIISVPLQASHS